MNIVRGADTSTVTVTNVAMCVMTSTATGTATVRKKDVLYAVSFVATRIVAMLVSQIKT
jgi:hypothetical protein